MTRKQARELTFKLLYEADIQKEPPEKILDIYYMQKKVDNVTKEYIEKIMFGVFENIADIDARITASSEKWSFERISKVAAACLRLSVFEILHCEDIPDSVSINEAVSLVKIYDGEEAAGFVNGVLASILKSKQ